MRLLGLLCLTLAYIGLTDSTCSCNNPNYSFKLTGAYASFPCKSTRNIYLQTGRYVEKNIMATRMQMYKDNVIVAFPRFRQGVPFSLATFSLKSRECRPALNPYPCWSLHEEGNCEALQSVIDLVIDSNEILWVLDFGVVNNLEQPVRRCPPKVVAIEAKTGQVVKIIDLSPFTTSQSQLNYLVVDHNDEGRAFVYVSDAGTGAIIVYDVYAGSGFRIVLPQSVVASGSIYDVLFLSLIRKPNEKVLYFTYVNSPRLYYINVASLQRGQTAGAIVDVGAKPNGPIILVGTDNGASLFFRLKGQNDIFVWNTLTCFKQQNFVLVQPGNDDLMATDVVPGYKNLMWVLESNFHDYITNTQGSLGAAMSIHPLIKNSDD